MRKNLTSIGNSLGLVIEKPILALLRIDRATQIEISTDGERLILVPVRDAKDNTRGEHKAAPIPLVQPNVLESSIRQRVAG